MTLLTVEELARWLKVSTSWIRQHAQGSRRPVLPGIKLGRYWRFEERAVEQWLTKLKRGGQGV